MDQLGENLHRGGTLSSGFHMTPIFEKFIILIPTSVEELKLIQLLHVLSKAKILLYFIFSHDVFCLCSWPLAASQMRRGRHQ